MNSTYFSNIRKEVYDLLTSPPSKVLEIGCGEGFFSDNFDSAVEYWGIEPTDACFVADKKLYKTLNGLYENVENEIPDNYFDLVVCNDVIEHMSNPDLFLKRVQSKIKPNGYILGSVPNVRHHENLYSLIFKRDWEYQDWGVLDRTHLKFFTEKSLSRTLKASGLSIVKIQLINSFGFRITSIKKLLKSILIIIFGLDARALQIAFLCQNKPENPSQ